MQKDRTRFIYKYDKFKKGLPLYHVDRYVRETKELFEDGSHIIYVNGNYKGKDEIGQLISDFHQADPEKIHYDAKNGSVYEKRNSGMCAGGYASGTDRMQFAYEAGTGSRYRECKQ